MTGLLPVLAQKHFNFINNYHSMNQNTHQTLRVLRYTAGPVSIA